MTQVTRIVAAVVDVRNLTLYVEDGSTITIPQGDPRLRKIISEATPQLIAHGWADVTIGPADENSYAQFEQEGSGAVKFFRIAKAKLKNLFTEKPVTDTPVLALSIGQVPAPQDTPATPALMPRPVSYAAAAAIAAMTPAEPVPEEVKVEDGSDDQVEEFEPIVETPSPQLEQTMGAIEEIMKHAIPASAAEFHEKDVAKQGNVVEIGGETIKAHNDNEDSSHTIIAVVGDKVIPGMERIKTQFSRAAKMGSTVGVENFLKRIASVIEKRSHSIDDLLKFMERGDLPIADDGSILIYKVLARKGSRSDGKYVDCHTKNVEQWTGAFVCMDPSLVDHNRSNECSNGLHVARRGYIRCFSGDVCVLAKLAPEDVIAVPSYDANKMRVCGYHILVELSDAQHNLIKQNRPLTDDPEGKQLLANAIAGKHVRRTHEVRITAQQGGGVVVKALAKAEAPTPVPTPDAPNEVVALENLASETLDQNTDPKEVIKEVEKEQLSRKEQAQKLYDEYAGLIEPVKNGEASQLDLDFALHQLRQFKKAAKVGWDKLGITDTYVMSGLPESTKTPPMSKGKIKVKATKKARKAKAKVEAKKAASKPNNATVTNKEFLKVAKAVAPKVKPVPQVHDVDFGDEPQDRTGGVADVVQATHSEGSARERIQKLLAIGLGSTGIAQSVLIIKKQSKKSWAILGVSNEQAEQIMKLAGSQ